MIKFVLKKLMNKKWMMLCLFIGNILFIAIASSNPMYQASSQQRMLLRTFSNYVASRNEYPGTIDTRLAFSTNSSNKIDSPIFGDIESVPENILKELNVNAFLQVEICKTARKEANPIVLRDDDISTKKISIAYMTDIENHVELIGGNLYSSNAGEDGIIDCMISQNAMIHMDLLLGEVIELYDYKDAVTGKNIRLRISGVFKEKSPDDLYWVNSPDSYESECFIDRKVFLDHIMGIKEEKRNMEYEWFQLVDYEKLKQEDAGNIYRAGLKIQNEVTKNGRIACNMYFMDSLGQFLKTKDKMNITMWILQVPVFILLAAFIFMVSNQSLEMEKNEIAILKSRGNTNRQIIVNYLMQSVILAALGLVAGLLLGYFLCKLLGASNAFLEFVGRSSLDAKFTPAVFIYGFLAAVLAIITMTLPVTLYVNTTIVEFKRRLGKRNNPLWRRMFLDVILFLISLYFLYSFYQQKELIIQKIKQGAALDPALFLVSSLFILSLGLLSLRFIPLITAAFYKLGKLFWSPSIYASFLQIIRNRVKQGFISAFIILTVSIGIFNANTARTINKNEEDRIRYTDGADIVMMEKWDSNAYMLQADPNTQLLFSEPDFWKYKNLDGIESITKVIRDNNTQLMLRGTELKNVSLMAINTKEFGETTELKDHLLDKHWYNYLNLIAKNPQSILVSTSFKKDFNVKTGDVIHFKGVYGSEAEGIVASFVDYWPSFQPKNNDEAATNNYLIVANFDQIMNDYGIVPYEIWIKVKDSTGFIYDFIKDNHMKLVKFSDAKADLIDSKNDIVLQVTNGMLTIDFIIILILCSIGFLIYWINSIKSRELLFGVYRAMGLSKKEIWKMLINEQVFISGIAITIGVLIGLLSSRLFIPLIELTYSPGNNPLPIELVTSNQDLIRLLAAILSVFILCMIVLVKIISQIRISQALKLGEE